MKNCPCCDGSLLDYLDQESGFIEYVCWQCGHYESNSPAFKQNPERFENLVRENPFYFLKKFRKSTENLQREESTDDFTMPRDNLA